MAEFNVRSDSVNVEQVMEQIRARIREKRGVDYTEQQIRELAAVKLEKFLDPRGVRSDLLEQFRRSQAEQPAPPNYAFEDDTIFETHRGPLRFIRRLLNPILKLFFNPNPIIQALHIQSQLNTMNASRRSLDALHYEVLHNLVLETTRLGIEVKNLKMRVESFASRLEFNERRARALESVVVYRPEAVGGDEPAARPHREPRQEPRHDQRHEPRHEPRPQRFEPRVHDAAPQAPQPGGEASQAAERGTPETPAATTAAAGATPEGPGQRSRRRRRRRGRRGGAPAAAVMAQHGAGGGPPQTTGDQPAMDVEEFDDGDDDGSSEPDAEAARAVTAPHSATAERVEQALAAESVPTELKPAAAEQNPSSPAGPVPPAGPDDTQ